MTNESWIEITRQRAKNIRANNARILLTNKQRVAVLMIFKGFEREERLAALSKLLARRIVTVNLMSRDEASLIIDESFTDEFKEFLDRGDF